MMKTEIACRIPDEGKVCRFSVEKKKRGAGDTCV